eukprot:EG_transcript_7781
MLQMMAKTSRFHLGPRLDIVVMAHHTWAPVTEAANGTRLLLLDEATFFDMQNAAPGANRTSLGSQSSANKLRIFQVFPAALQYDLIVMLDVDIVVQANFLLLMGSICRDTLYAVSHQVIPEMKRSVRYYQSRDFTAEEIAFVRARDLYLINAGQFALRPSARMAALFWRAYLSYKQQPLESLFEQGHLNTVLLLEGQVKYTLTHLTLLGYGNAKSTPIPAAYALIHACLAGLPSAKKVAALRRHLPGAFRAQSVVQQHILRRVLASLDAPPKRRGRGRVKGHSAEPVKATADPGDVRLDVVGLGNESQSQAPPKSSPRSVDTKGFPELVAAYVQLVSNHTVSHMCEIGEPGPTAAAALCANPAAGLTLFAPKGAAPYPLGVLRSSFPSRVLHRPGMPEDTLRAYATQVAESRLPRCSTVLLFLAGSGDLKILRAVRAIVAPESLLFLAADAPTPDVGSGWQAATASGTLNEEHCHSTPGTPWWCVGRFKLA